MDVTIKDRGHLTVSFECTAEEYLFLGMALHGVANLTRLAELLGYAEVYFGRDKDSDQIYVTEEVIEQ